MIAPENTVLVICGPTGPTGATGADGGGSGGVTGPTGATGSNWNVTVNAQTGTAYSLAATDNGKVVTLSNVAAITLTVPLGLPVNFACEIIQISTGQVTVSAGGGVTVNSYNGWVKLAGRHAPGTLVSYAPNIFNLAGNIVA